MIQEENALTRKLDILDFTTDLFIMTVSLNKTERKLLAESLENINDKTCKSNKIFSISLGN